ncbi:MAG: hypothetical protein IPH54_08110 [Rhodoferax sp.]|nr:hypothetical protein [Rhodoferax sp.]
MAIYARHSRASSYIFNSKTVDFGPTLLDALPVPTLGWPYLKQPTIGPQPFPAYSPAFFPAFLSRRFPDRGFSKLQQCLEGKAERFLYTDTRHLLQNTPNPSPKGIF